MVSIEFEFKSAIRLPNKTWITTIVLHDYEDFYIDQRGYIRFDAEELDGLCVPLSNVSYWLKRDDS